MRLGIAFPLWCMAIVTGLTLLDGSLVLKNRPPGKEVSNPVFLYLHSLTLSSFLHFRHSFECIPLIQLSCTYCSLPMSSAHRKRNCIQQTLLLQQGENCSDRIQQNTALAQKIHWVILVWKKVCSAYIQMKKNLYVHMSHFSSFCFSFSSTFPWWSCSSPVCKLVQLGS